MKLQIEGQKLRLRLDETELATLLAGDVLAICIRFVGVFSIECRVQLVEGADATFSGSAERWQIGLPGASVREHAARLPTREGLRFTLTGPGGADALELLFDVDVRDSVRRRRSS